MQHRCGNDLEQRRAGAVQINAGRGMERVVQRLAGIFFEVRALDFDLKRATVVSANGNFAAAHDRQFVLADLIALRQIGIEVVFAREYAFARDLRIDGQTEADRLAEHGSIRYRQRARQRDIDRAGLRIRFGAVMRRGAREQLARGIELGVDFQADDGLPIAHAPGSCVCQSLTSWN